MVWCGVVWCGVRIYCGEEECGGVQSVQGLYSEQCPTSPPVRVQSVSVGLSQWSHYPLSSLPD